jgi:hypothetical protein
MGKGRANDKANKEALTQTILKILTENLLEICMFHVGKVTNLTKYNQYSMPKRDKYNYRYKNVIFIIVVVA